MSQPTIRRAGPADAPTLVAIGLQTFTETFQHLYSAEDFAAYVADAYAPARIQADLTDPAKAMWLVEAGGQAIGYALAGPCGLPHPEVTPACGELKRIYFTQASQGGGLGKALFWTVMDWLQSDGPRDVWIGVWSENHRALRFYDHQGFEKAGEYDFQVGQTVDLEFILRRSGDSFSKSASQLAEVRHNFA
ncbi:MAG: GNAT family N-acetyltransferase [Alphaproteobacteria bacterium]|nr:GNAT family N-acetyltransferase [Alphaproteobacteria bacterium]MBU1515566.1 GNAT family N-acetyltransferase [Alphaproteobacteria bacterium]MBU2095564.1 GNAT family N-acetyltransferase [Alphaproteobacteria bacterium]MBU2150805.1 GNAT family N-acetyltransferase [Alphaproteobacteria bacterium]MBU2307070.1 GNAT family N-acetyltransferase [Alphaproteobacteria bacterium]